VAGTVDPDRAEAALEKLSKIAGPNFDQSQMDELKKKLAKLGKSDKTTTSGSEAPVDDTPKPQPEAARALTGRDVDWSEYNLDFNVAHLYKRAVYRETPHGPKWVAMNTDFISTTRDFRNHGKRVNAPGSTDKTETEFLNLGEYLNDMCNGRESWKIAAVMPAGSQCGVLLERQMPIILPDPQPLKKSEEVEAPTDQALQATEDAALAFMAGQKEIDNEAPVSDYSSAAPSEDIGLTPIVAGSVEHAAAVESLDESGAVPARSGSIVAHALEVAAPLTTAAPTAGMVQPEAVHNPVIQAPVPAAGYSAAADVLRALSDPNFRSSLPQEE
jgi:hypothetical protein